MYTISSCFTQNYKNFSSQKDLLERSDAKEVTKIKRLIGKIMMNSMIMKMIIYI